jgi:N-acetylmuramoyl-L-alanine amidase
MDVTHITVHCSASKLSQKVDSKVIDKWHRQRGFLKIGYHFVILRDGQVEKGRALTEVGAHVSGHNAGNLGICLVGGLDEAGKPQDNFSPEQFGALIDLLEELLQQFPNAQILGHRDWPNVKKACPCFDVKKFLEKNR